MRKLKNLRSLERQIMITRAKMHELWNQRGFTDSEVLAASIELDHLLNQYQKIIFPKYSPNR